MRSICSRMGCGRWAILPGWRRWRMKRALRWKGSMGAFIFMRELGLLVSGGYYCFGPSMFHFQILDTRHVFPIFGLRRVVALAWRPVWVKVAGWAPSGGGRQARERSISLYVLRVENRKKYVWRSDFFEESCKWLMVNEIKLHFFGFIFSQCGDLGGRNATYEEKNGVKEGRRDEFHELARTRGRKTG